MFNKCTVQVHAFIMSEDGEVIEELSSDVHHVRTVDQFSELLDKAKGDIADFNAQQPNRRQRRAAKS